MKKTIIFFVFAIIISLAYWSLFNHIGLPTALPALKHGVVWYISNDASLYYERLYNQNIDKTISYEPLYTICNTFDFIPSEWILKWKSPLKSESENSSCAVLRKEMLQTNKVKWIVHPNKTLENLGCTSRTKECHEGPHFDMAQNIRINMPPCCRQKILFVFEVLTTGFRMLKIPHLLEAGGVLGWARNQRMIPYDEDLDMLVNGSYWRSSSMMQFLDNIQTKYGFFVDWKKEHIGYPGTKYHFSVSFSKTNQNGVGLWSYRINRKGKVELRYFAEKNRNEWENSVINPPRSVNFNGIETYVPNKPIEYVERYYGKRWTEELQCKNVSAGKKCF